MNFVSQILEIIFNIFFHPSFVFLTSYMFALKVHLLFFAELLFYRSKLLLRKIQINLDVHQVKSKCLLYSPAPILLPWDNNW
jgi:hypothetical protein